VSVATIAGATVGSVVGLFVLILAARATRKWLREESQEGAGDHQQLWGLWGLCARIGTFGVTFRDFSFVALKLLPLATAETLRFDDAGKERREATLQAAAVGPTGGGG
jgi:hypothetical protein